MTHSDSLLSDKKVIQTKSEVRTDRIFWQDSIWVVPPPQIQTVKKTTSSEVENIICRAYVAVSLIDKAKVMAPRRPGEGWSKNTKNWFT